MKKYEFVDLSCTTTNIFMSEAYEHRAVINEYAADGYRYVGSITTETDSHGGIKRMDLVFEKDAQE